MTGPSGMQCCHSLTVACSLLAVNVSLSDDFVLNTATNKATTCAARINFYEKLQSWKLTFSAFVALLMSKTTVHRSATFITNFLETFYEFFKNPAPIYFHKTSTIHNGLWTKVKCLTFTKQIVHLCLIIGSKVKQLN
ncbi:hypothetical protein ACKWTF_003697 [Chironomus riparius]